MVAARQATTWRISRALMGQFGPINMGAKMVAVRVEKLAEAIP